MKKSVFLIHVCVIVFLMFFFGNLEPFPGLNPMSMKVIGVFAGVLYGWILIDIGWPSILGLVALGLTNYMPMNSLLAQAFGSQTMVMIIALLFLAAFVQQAELTEVIVDYLLSRKISTSRPFVLLFNFLLAAFIASLLSQAIAVLVIFLEIFRKMLQKTGIPAYDRTIPTFFVGMAVAVNLGDVALPFKGGAIPGIGAFEAITGTSMNFLGFTVFMLPLCILTLACYALACKYILRVDLAQLARYRHEGTAVAAITPYKKASLIAIVVSLLVLLLYGVLPQGWAVTKVLHQLGLGGVSMAILAVLLIVRIQGEPLMDLAKVAKFFPWKVFFVLVVLFPIAACLSSDSLGLKALLADSASVIFADLPRWLVVLFVVMLPALVSQVANNMVVVSIFVPIVCLLSQALGINPELLTCLVILGAALAMFFPAANPVNAILFAQKDLVTFKAEAGLGAVLCLILGLFIALFGSIWANIAF